MQQTSLNIILTSFFKSYWSYT